MTIFPLDRLSTVKSSSTTDFGKSPASEGKLLLL